MNRPVRYGLGMLLSLVILSAVFALVAVVPQSAVAATTELTVTKYAYDGTTVLAQETLDYQWLKDNISVMGDGTTHYYHQGPVFLDDPDEENEQVLRWNQAEDTNWDTKDMGAVKGTDVKDLCELVGGMAEGDTLEIKASDGFNKTFAYENVYDYSSREGPMVICWYRDGNYPDTGYTEGMRLVWFAEATYKEGPTSIEALPSGDYHVFGNYDWFLAADPEYWYYYYNSGEMYPTTTGLSVREVSELNITVTGAVYEDPVVSKYDITPGEDDAYTIGETADGIATMTVNSGVSGFGYFAAGIGAVVSHSGEETVVFTHTRDGSQIGLNATRADFDEIGTAQAGFNVQPGDVVKVYIVDELSNAVEHNPVVLQ